MSFLDSLTVDAFGLSIVFFVLVALSLIIKLITKIISGLHKEEQSPSQPALEAPGTSVQYAGGELKLIDVDEKTAALIMAIVSDESGIPLSQLAFKSIRLMKQEVSK